MAVRGGFQLRLNSSIEVVTLFAKASSSFEEPSVAFMGWFQLRLNSSIELVRALCEISSSFFIKCEEKVTGRWGGTSYRYLLNGEEGDSLPISM